MGQRRKTIREREAVLQKAVCILNDGRAFVLPSLAGAEPPAAPLASSANTKAHGETPLSARKGMTRPLARPGRLGDKENIAQV